MACQTGIRASDELLRCFAECKRPHSTIRLVKIVIRNEELCVNLHEKMSTDWEIDWQRSLPACLDSFEPCFVLFRVETIDQQQQWLMLSFADDSAPIREKMLLAATRSTLKSEFGQNYILQEYHASSKEDCTLRQYKQWLKSKTMPGPMTDVERELMAAHEEQANLQERQRRAYGLATQTLRGIAFPIDQEAEEKLKQLATGLVNYVQLSVDTLNEAIKLERFDSISVHQLSHVILKDKPRYHLFRFVHTYNGQTYNSLVFIYSLPSSGCTIKERMLYSSCKGPFLDTIERFLDLKPDRKIEMESCESIDEQYLLDHVHPVKQQCANVPMFAKPRGPSGRGLRRITKPVVPIN